MPIIHVHASDRAACHVASSCRITRGYKLRYMDLNRADRRFTRRPLVVFQVWHSLQQAQDRFIDSNVWGWPEVQG